MSIAISVLMPVYNGEFFLNETLDSLIAQSFSDFEVICIDDGSTDGSLNILEEYAETHEFIRVFSKVNEGTAAKSVNFGLQFMQGEYFMYTSQDDLFSPNLLEVSYRKARELNADAVVPDTIFYFPNGNNKNGIFGLHNNHSKILNGNEAFSYSLNWNISGFVLWKRSLLNRLGGEFFDFSINSDEYTTRLLYFYSNKIAFTQEKFYYRQNNPNSITKKWNSKLLESFITIKMLETFIKDNSTQVDKDLCRVWETLYHELIRICFIFYTDKGLALSEDEKLVENKLEKIYNENVYKIRKITLKSWKQKIKKNIIQVNFSVLKALVYLQVIYNK